MFAANLQGLVEKWGADEFMETINSLAKKGAITYQVIGIHETKGKMVEITLTETGAQVFNGEIGTSQIVYV